MGTTLRDELMVYVSEYVLFHPELSKEEVERITNTLLNTKELIHILLGVNPLAYRASSHVLSNLISAYKYSGIKDKKAWEILTDFLFEACNSVSFYDKDFYRSSIDLGELMEEVLTEVNDLNQHIDKEIIDSLNLDCIDPRPLIKWCKNNIEYAQEKSSIWFFLKIVIKSQDIINGRNNITRLFLELVDYDKQLA